MNIVILAAGSAHRLGGCKPLVRIHGESLLRRTAKVVSQLPGRCFVVIPPRAPRLRLELQDLAVSVIENPGRDEGLASSVRLAISCASQAPGVLLLPADLPDLSLRELRRLIYIWRGAPRKVVARRVDAHAATPLILPKWLYARAAALRGDVGLKGALTDLAPSVLHLLELPSVAHDIDTPQQLAAARRRYRPRGL